MAILKQITSDEFILGQALEWEGQERKNLDQFVDDIFTHSLAGTPTGVLASVVLYQIMEHPSLEFYAAKFKGVMGVHARDVLVRIEEAVGALLLPALQNKEVYFKISDFSRFDTFVCHFGISLH